MISILNTLQMCFLSIRLRDSTIPLFIYPPAPPFPLAAAASEYQVAKWEAGPAMRYVRENFGIAFIPPHDGVGGGQVMVVGKSVIGGILDSVSIYNVSAATWSFPNAVLPDLRTYFGMAHIPEQAGGGGGASNGGRWAGLWRGVLGLCSPLQRGCSDVE